MTIDTDFVVGSPGGRFVDHASREAGNRLWDEARQRHGLQLGIEVPDHPMNLSRGHDEKRIGTFDRQRGPLGGGAGHTPARWYPVGGCLFESYGDLRYRIRMLFTVPDLSVSGSHAEARRIMRNKQTDGRRRMVNFRSTDEGTRIERYSASGRQSRLDIAHTVLGFEVIRDSGDNAGSLWCPEGLAQALEVLGDINGSAELLGVGLVEGAGGMISGSEYRRADERSFDRGERLAGGAGVLD